MVQLVQVTVDGEMCGMFSSMAFRQQLKNKKWRLGYEY